MRERFTEPRFRVIAVGYGKHFWHTVLLEGRARSDQDKQRAALVEHTPRPWMVASPSIREQWTPWSGLECDIYARVFTRLAALTMYLLVHCGGWVVIMRRSR